mgnify:CR=1 FL=1
MQATALLQELVRTPSIFGQEHAATAIVERELRRLDVEVTSIPFDVDVLSRLGKAQQPFCTAHGRRNLIARLRGKRGGRSLILNCHLDVVPAGDPKEWDHHPFSGAVVDGRLYGRGAFDDKAGVAICLEVLNRLVASDLSGDLIAHFVLEDETTGNGSLLCLEGGPHADAAIIVDGTRGERGINQHAGNLKLRLSVFGKPASVSVSHMGLNAAELLAEICLALKAATLDLNKANAPPWSQFPSPNQLSTIALHCDESALTVPTVAEATLYATFTPPHTVASFMTMARAIVDDIRRQAGAERAPELQIEFASEPVRSNAAEIEGAICRAGGRNIPFGPSTGTSDMRHFVDRNIPCVLFGPGQGYNPHRVNEHFELKSLDEMAALLTKVAVEWCG